MAKQEPRVPVHGDPGHWIHISESPRNVRIVLGGKTLADSKHVKLLREDGILPVYYFPASDVRTDLMVPRGKKTECPYKGEASYWSLKAGNKTADNAAWSYINPLLEASELKNLSGTRWMLGMKKTKKSSSTRAILTNGSM